MESVLGKDWFEFLLHELPFLKVYSLYRLTQGPGQEWRHGIPDLAEDSSLRTVKNKIIRKALAGGRFPGSEIPWFNRMIITRSGSEDGGARFIPGQALKTSLPEAILAQLFPVDSVF